MLSPLQGVCIRQVIGPLCVFISPSRPKRTKHLGQPVCREDDHITNNSKIQ